MKSTTLERQHQSALLVLNGAREGLTFMNEIPATLATIETSLARPPCPDIAVLGPRSSGENGMKGKRGATEGDDQGTVRRCPMVAERRRRGWMPGDRT